MASAEAVKLLKQTSLFARFTEQELEAVFRASHERTFESGTTIVREGHPGGLGFYLIFEGQVEVRKEQKSLAKLGIGDYFGEMALLLDRPRTADVVALQKTRCLMLTPWELRGIVGAYPDVALKIMNELAQRLSATNQALSE